MRGSAYHICSALMCGEYLHSGAWSVKTTGFPVATLLNFHNEEECSISEMYGDLLLLFIEQLRVREMHETYSTSRNGNVTVFQKS